MTRKDRAHQRAETIPRRRKWRWLTIVVAGVMVVAAALFVFVNTVDNVYFGKDSFSSSGTTSVAFVKHGELQFLNSHGEAVAAIDIEIAEDDSKREQGLMYRDTLLENRGMLFIFYEDEIKSFWMKNTVVPLDMIFVDANNKIVTIRKHTTPFSEEEYSSTEPTRYVLEVNAGFTDRHNIAVGDHIKWQRQ